MLASLQGGAGTPGPHLLLPVPQRALVETCACSHLRSPMGAHVCAVCAHVCVCIRVPAPVAVAVVADPSTDPAGPDTCLLYLGSPPEEDMSGLGIGADIAFGPDPVGVVDIPPTA